VSNVKAIRADADYNAALSRIDALMGAEPRPQAGDELDVLADLVEHCDDRSEPMGFPSAIAALRFRAEQVDLTPRDLAPFLEAVREVAVETGRAVGTGALLLSLE